MRWSSMLRIAARAISVIAAFMFVYGCLTAVDMPSRPRVAPVASAVQCPAGSATILHKPFAFTAPAGEVVTSVCVNDGKQTYSCNANGTCSGCYDVTGIGTQTATVSELKKCKSVNSVTFFAAVPAVPARAIVVVLNSVDNSPISGATVTIAFASASLSGTTSDDGEVSFSNVPMNEPATITATKDGHTAQATTSGFVSGDNTTTMQINLAPPPPPPTSDVTLTALDPHNLPIAGGTVTISYSNGAPTVSGSTDAQGQVSFLAQPANVSATVTLESACGNSTATLVFPSGPYSATLHNTPVETTLRVSVIDGSGPVSGATVTIGALTGTTDASGDVVFTGVPVGSTRVDASFGSATGGDTVTLTGCSDNIAIQIF